MSSPSRCPRCAPWALLCVLCAAMCFLAVAFITACTTANATGEPYSRTGQIVSAERGARAGQAKANGTNSASTNWSYETRFEFEETLPSGEKTAISNSESIFHLCDEHVSETVEVCFDADGFIDDVRF